MHLCASHHNVICIITCVLLAILCWKAMQWPRKKGTSLIDIIIAGRNEKKEKKKKQTERLSACHRCLGSAAKDRIMPYYWCTSAVSISCCANIPKVTAIQLDQKRDDFIEWLALNIQLNTISLKLPCISHLMLTSHFCAAWDINWPFFSLSRWNAIHWFIKFVIFYWVNGHFLMAGCMCLILFLQFFTPYKIQVNSNWMDTLRGTQFNLFSRR